MCDSDEWEMRSETSSVVGCVGGGTGGTAFDEPPDEFLGEHFLGEPAATQPVGEPAASHGEYVVYSASAEIMSDEGPAFSEEEVKDSVELPVCTTPLPKDRATASLTTATPEVEQREVTKRRRLRCKTPTSQSSSTQASGTPGSSSTPDSETKITPDFSFPGPATWQSLTRKQRHALVYERVRLYWTKQLLGVDDRGGKKQSYRECRAAWQSLDKKARRGAYVKWLEATTPPSYVTEFAEEVFPEPVAKKLNLCGRTALLTYVGPWGLKGDDGLLKELGTMTLDGLVEFLREDEDTLDLWTRLQAHVLQLQKAALADDFACCMEICTKSFASARVCRIHFHVFLRSQRRMWLQNHDLMFFEGCRPHLAAIVGGIFIAKSQATWIGAFYCTADKVGSVLTASSKVPFVDYLVQGQWIMNLTQSGKITLATARRYILQSCHNVQRYLKDLEILQQEQMKACIAKAKHEACRVLVASQKPFITLKPVVEWTSQYRVIKPRYQFLVLEGPTMMAKTAFACSLTPKGMDYLEINCSSGEEPDMRAYRYGQHGLVLFDEVSPLQVAKQRKLFQSGTAEVQLGCSSTNIYSYTVFLHAIRLVCCSNVWSEQLEKMSPGDADWVRKNGVHIKVDRPLYCMD